MAVRAWWSGRGWPRLAAVPVLGCLALAGLLAPLPIVAATAEEGAAVKAQHGDWQLVCKTPTGSKNEICALVQDVTSESNPNIGLSVQIQNGKEAGTVLRVFAPLGVLLPPGLGLQIDETKVGHAPFVRCQSVGCVAQVTLNDDLIARFRAGKTAWFIVYQSQEAGIGIPVSLNGLPDGLDALN